MTSAFYLRSRVTSRRHALKAIWAVFGISVILSLSATAQEKEAASMESRWEYCELFMSGAKLEGGNAIGIAFVRYATEDGWRGEQVEVVRPAPPGRKPAGGEEVQALGKALAQLGRQGWELVGVTSEAPEHWGFRKFFFKRRVK